MITSCSVLTYKNYDKQIKDIRLGKTKNEVFRIMGTKYTIAGLQETAEGDIESLFFEAEEKLSYIMVFRDNKLIEVSSIPVVVDPCRTPKISQ